MTGAAAQGGVSFPKFLLGVVAGAIAVLAAAAALVRQERRTAGCARSSLAQAETSIGERLTVVGQVGEVVSAKSFT